MTPPVPPTPPQQLTGAMLNSRIAHGDPAFPKELWGKTLGEGMRFYAIMREDFMRRNNPAGQPGGDPGQQPPPADRGPRPAYVPPAPAAPPSAVSSFDPTNLQQMIKEAVTSALARSPMAMQAADSTHDRMKREFPDWMHYDSAILETLEGAGAEQLSNPETWKTAYYFVKGRMLSQPGQPPAPMAPQHQPPYQPPTVFGQPSGQPTVTRPPEPPTSANPSWFTEGPTAPPAQAGGSVDPRNDPRVIAMAARHGIPVDEYVQWLGGNVPPMQAPRA